MQEMVGRRKALQLLAAGGAAIMGGPAALAQPGKLPDPARLLFLQGEEQLFAFSNIDKLFATRAFQRSARPYPLPEAAQSLQVEFEHAGRAWTTETFMAKNRVAGIVAVKNGQIVLERYGLGHSRQGKWTSFSVAKSLTSTLVGAAIQDGHIKSVIDPVTKYLPVLKGSAFDGAVIRDLLRMSGGEAWNENYLEPNSDVNQHIAIVAKRNQPGAMLRHMAKLPRAAPNGTYNLYRTGESYLLGEIVAAAIGSNLAPYVTEKIWKPFGMESDGYWMLTADNAIEWGGGCFSATSRDYARFGQFILNGGQAAGRQILPEGWVAEASAPSAPSGPKNEREAYGYQWWVGPGTGFAALGVCGQAIYIDPPQKLVVAIQSAWTEPDPPANNALAFAFLRAVTAAAA